MSVITVIKKIGEKIISIVEWPFKHAVALEELLSDGLKDEPEVKAAIIGLTERAGAIGADTVAAIAEHGLDVPEDLKDVEDVKALFAYIQTTFLPAIEKAYADFKSATAGLSTPAAPAAATPAPVEAPGLHNVVPA